MDAVTFPPPPAPFLDEDLDFGDFTFASAPAAAFAAFDDDWGDFVASGLGSDAAASAPPTAAPAAAPSSSSSWAKPRGPLPLSLFGTAAADGGQEEEEGPAGSPPTATAPQRALSFPSNGSGPADLKDLIVGLYGSQPPPAADAVPVPQVEAEDDEGFGDDDWEFTAATAEPVDQDGDGPGHADGIGKIEVSLPAHCDAFPDPLRL